MEPSIRLVFHDDGWQFCTEERHDVFLQRIQLYAILYETEMHARSSRMCSDALTVAANIVICYELGE